VIASNTVTDKKPVLKVHLRDKEKVAL
jgi:hypothetical protein